MLVVPHHTLPFEKDLRTAVLLRVFPDHSSHSFSLPGAWGIHLEWPDRADFYVDPQLAEGLRWWSPNLAVRNLPLEHRREEYCQLSLNDSWSLLAWSEWFAAQSRLEPPAEVILLHIDDHDDLLPPHVVIRPDGWQDPFTLQPIDLSLPGTIDSAIASGAIGMGSYIVPLLYWIPKVHVRHLRATGASSAATRHCTLAQSTLQDPWLDGVRPAVQATRVSERMSSPLEYISTRNINDWLRDLPDAPVLLHLDLDYCNNRYNCNANWEASPRRHDPGPDEIITALDEIFEALALGDLPARIVDITVALSPGFFPAEFWKLSVERVRSHLHHLRRG